MNQHKSTLSFAIVFVILISSCSVSVEKRLYRPGYHVEVVNSNKRSNHTPMQTNHPVKIYANNPALIKTSMDSANVSDVVTIHSTQSTLSGNDRLTTRLTQSEKKYQWKDSCDIIVMASGARVEAIVIEIKNGAVQYKKCDDLKGRVYVVKTRLVDNITLRNGEVFVPDNRIVVDKEKERKKSNTLFIMSIVALAVAAVCFLLSFFIFPFSIISFSFSVIDLFFSFILILLNIKPGQFAPSYRTKFTWIFCLIAFILLIAAMILVFV